MVKTPVCLGAFLGSLISISAQEALPVIPEFDIARASLSQTGALDFGAGNGSLDVWRLELRSLLSKPLSPFETLSILPMFEYKATSLDFADTPAGFPIGDEDLHSLNLSAFAVSSRPDSPWTYAAWARAEMAGDYQDVGGDDFTFDVAAGAGYRVHENFMLGAGGALLNLNGDMIFYPGIVFDWKVSDCLRAGLYGPVFVAAYTPDANWEFSLRGDSGGDVWNIRDDGGASHSIRLKSYRLGLFASRRLTEGLWLTAGAGATFGNDVRLTQPDGDLLFEQDLNTGVFGQIGLRLITW